MCEKCNEALLAAATAASMLASAAKDLFEIHHHTEATTLAKAAAELFQEPRVSGETEADAQAPGKPENADEDVSPFHVDEKTGVVYVNGVAIGRAVLVRRPTKH